MSSAQAGSVERLPLRTKFFFGIGSAAESIALFALGSYAMLFYNQILGLNAGLAGLAVSASLLLDGFADPVVGSLSDRTRSRFGRRHGYMYFAPIPIALCIIAVFHPPKGASDLVLFFWFAISVSCLRISMTLFHTPHLAMGGGALERLYRALQGVELEQLLHLGGRGLHDLLRPALRVQGHA